mmetsp:Transcript_16252/g.39621  ORF Transcript_16252/g.39621 Transcript_16252/m.39621 type:complete len:211 (+) Transcript_16252:3-635(+)
MPSISILLHELSKLLAYAGADASFVRMGTSGGIGIEPGTVVLTETVFNAELKPYHRQVILGKVVQRPTQCNDTLVGEIHEAAHQKVKGISVIRANTMSANDFYEEQGRVDGALCEYSEEDRRKFLLNAHQLGIRNIEMEASAFVDFCTRMGFRAAVVCSTLVDRLKGDQISSTPEQLENYTQNSIQVATAWMRKTLEKTGEAAGERPKPS